MNCPLCNSHVPDGAKYCPKCGRRMDEAIQKSGKRSWTIFMVLFLILGIGAAGVLG